MNRRTVTRTGFAWVIIAASVARGGVVLHVDDDAAPAGDGTTWATAYRFVRDALTFASDPGNGVSVIRVAQGTYRPDRLEVFPAGTGSRAATFQLAGGVALEGGYAGIGAPDPDDRDIDQFSTILSGDLLANDDGTYATRLDNSFHVVSSYPSAAPAWLDGVTVTSGHADGLSTGKYGAGLFVNGGSLVIIDCTFVDHQAEQLGGAMYNAGGALTLTRCTFTANSAQDGGAMYNMASSPTLDDCVFSENHAGDDGGGMVNAEGSHAVLTGCDFLANEADDAGGGMINYGSSPTLIECDFDANLAAGGGAIRNAQGSSPGITSCSFSNNESLTFNSGGGAIKNTDDSSPAITGCTFDNNEASGTGGAIHSSYASYPCVVGSTFTSNKGHNGAGAVRTEPGPTRFENCVFALNTDADGAGAIAATTGTEIIGCTFQENSVAANGGSGGALWIDGDSVVSDCVFEANAAKYGGAIYLEDGIPTISGCLFLENTAVTRGGAMYFDNAAGGVVLSSVLAGNQAENSSGGAIRLDDAGTPQFVNCVLTGNTAVDGGAISAAFDATPTLINCTVSLNAASGTGGGLNVAVAPGPVLTSCILWGNTDNDGSTNTLFEQIYSTVAVPTINYSIVEGLVGGFGGVGNSGADPLFRNPAGLDGTPGTDDDNLRLAAGSPAIDAGDNTALPLGVITDLDGEPRFVDDPSIPDTGNPDGVNPIVDMGPFESQAACVGDIDTDGVVGIADFLAVLAAWGPCPGCPEDLDYDGTVGINDFLALLAAWGPCP